MSSTLGWEGWSLASRWPACGHTPAPAPPAGPPPPRPPSPHAESQQAAVVAGIFAALAASTYLCCTVAGPAIADNLPWLYQVRLRGACGRAGVRLRTA